MRIGIIGCGAIGSDVTRAADKMTEIDTIYIFDKKKKTAMALARDTKKAVVKKVKDFLPDVDAVMEAASQDAVMEYAEMILQAGKNLIILSIGSLLDEDFRKRLMAIATEKKCKIYLPSGAVCGIDGIKAAQMAEVNQVTLVTTKPPASLGIKTDKRQTLFDGYAREAIEKFPRNINVAACLSLAGTGFDTTNVKIVVDPVTAYNSHRILAHGKFGRLRSEMENLPNPRNPKTSYMASLSAISCLRKLIEPLQIA
jgi:aspartate dehydrogenase